MTQTAHIGGSSVGRVIRTSLVGIGFTIVVVLLLLWLAGVFHRKIDSGGVTASATAARPIGPEVRLVPVQVLRRPLIETAVGSIRAVHESAVASKLLAKVVAVNAQAGQQVKAGDVLVRLDDADLRAQLGQAEAVVAAAQAAREQAQRDFDRIKDLYERDHASKTEYDRVETALKSAVAELERAEQFRAQAQTLLSYATIRSPIDGRVVEKHVEVGDTAQPGQVLVTLYNPERMQLVASVRESLTQRLAVGQTIGVRIDALGKACEGQVSEIVPEAQSASRTFTVKVTGPCPPGVYSGMFGRLMIPLDEQEVLVIPQAAVQRVGQLDIVEVAEPSPAAGTDQSPTLRRRVVRLGQTHGELVEVLSGLRAGEEVAVASS